MTTIAVDAMGGDHAPKSEVEGAIRACNALNVRVILVGKKDVLQRELDLNENAASLPIEIRNATEVITMEDSAAKAVRAKKDSSIRVACRLHRDGEAHGVGARVDGGDMNRLGHFGIYRQRCASAAEGVYLVARIPNCSPMRWRSCLLTAETLASPSSSMKEWRLAITSNSRLIIV